MLPINNALCQFSKKEMIGSPFHIRHAIPLCIVHNIIFIIYYAPLLFSKNILKEVFVCNSDSIKLILEVNFRLSTHLLEESFVSLILNF